MSGKTEQADEGAVDSDAVVEFFEDWYHVPTLALLAIFMLWVRMQAVGRFVRGGQVYFSGNDAYYHYRQVSYTVRNWPFTMPFDPWTQYPQGTSVGQFGTLFDQLIATAALIVGLGSPSQHTIAMVTLVTPAVLGALVALPVYAIGKRLGGRSGGLFAVLVLALLPGTFLRRSTVGFADHHVAEVFFQTVAVLATMIAVRVVERERPVYEQLLDRDWAGLRPSVLWSVVAGVAIFLYLWVWPPGVVLVGILGVFYLVGLSLEYVAGRSTDHLAVVGIVSMLTVAVLSAMRVQSIGFSPSRVSLLQPALAFGVAVGCLLLAVIGRYWEREELDPRLYPVQVGALVLVGLGLLAVLAPDVYALIRRNVARSFLPGASDTAFTIAEAKSVFSLRGVSPLDYFSQQYGLTYVIALFGFVWLVVVNALSENARRERTLISVWTVFVLLMALSQVRFNYYLAAVIAVLNGWLFGEVTRIAGLRSPDFSLPDVKGYHVMIVLAVLLLIVAPLAPYIGVVNAVDQAKSNSVSPGRSVAWDNTGEWMIENTPAPGNYDNPDGDRMAYYGRYEETNDFEYPQGAYGVMSWWDYGHWLTVQGERIPHANPFQQGARTASAYFQAQNEERAEAIVSSLGEVNGGKVDELTTEQLRAAASNGSDGEGIRYVTIDDQMAGGKFSAITQWNSPGPEFEEANYRKYITTDTYRVGGQNRTLLTTSETYENTLLSRLYFDDADGLSHYRLVHEVDQYSIVGGVYRGQNRGRPSRAFPLGIGWENYGGPNATLGNLQANLSRAEQVGQALRLGNAYVYDAELESAIKTYERVPGATIEGEVDDENATITAVVVLETDTGRTFTYTQTVEAEDGEYSMTVPYSTEDELGVDEGATNQSVVAAGNYTLVANAPPALVEQLVEAGYDLPGATTVDVPESVVLEGGTVEADVSIPEQGNESEGNESADDSGSPSGDVAAPAPSLSGTVAARTGR